MQTDPTLLRYASAITEQKKCWELLAQSLTGFSLSAATPKNTQQHTTECATCNILQCCVRLHGALLHECPTVLEPGIVLTLHLGQSHMPGGTAVSGGSRQLM